MTLAILDTNVVVQSLISSPTSMSTRVLDAFHNGWFRLAYSSAVVEELLEVLCTPRIRIRHRLSDSGILAIVESLLVRSLEYRGRSVVPLSLARDLTDNKFLALALESRAEFLVTNDHRHLIPIGQFHETRIVTPPVFLQAINYSSKVDMP